MEIIRQLDLGVQYKSIVQNKKIILLLILILIRQLKRKLKISILLNKF